MTPDLEKILYEQYPEFFQQRNWSMARTCMVWGCATEDGWFSLIDGTAETITNRAKNTGRPVPQAVQVKEKFGGLRIYCRHNDEFDAGVTWVAEELSMWVCEITGRPGRVVSRDGWLQALCPDEASRYGIKFRASMPRPSAKEYPTILNGPIEVPHGWLRLVDSMLRAVRRIDKAPISIARIGFEASTLVVSVGDAVPDFAAGAIAFAQAIARRTDKGTGALDIPVISQSEGGHGGNLS